MIDRQQLAEALARLDPRDREVLDYSLRRHVPDNDLAAVFDCGPSDVARMRAAAVERLADSLGVQRGADLGHVLTALLEQATWDMLPATRPAEGGRAPGLASLGNRGADAGPAAAPASGEPPVSVGDALGGPVASPPTPPPAASPGASGGLPSDTVAGSPTATEKRPVLGMLAGDYDGRGDRDADPQRRQAAPPPAPRGRRWTIAAAVLVAVLVAVGLGSVLFLGEDSGSSTADSDTGTRPFEPQREAVGDPFPSDPQSVNQYPTATIEGNTMLFDAPDGAPKERISDETEWGSPRVLSIVERQGQWLAVVVPELPNGEVGWIRDDQVASLSTVDWAMRADLRTRTLEVEQGGKTIRTMKIGIGRADHPTPTGRFAVTDKLKVTDSGSPYGCCVVALTGHQTSLPDGWPGGDRLAVHATTDTSGLGHAVSLGCMRTDEDDARWVMNAVPLGTPVFITESSPPEKPASQSKPTRR